MPGIWAAGDIARWPDPHIGDRIRVEHWVVAEREGQAAARNMLGRREPFNHAPFFWSQHYDVTINYVGHARRWDRIDVSGSMGDHDCIAAFRADGKTLAVASIFRDLDSLRAELAMERGDSAELEALVVPPS
jgi:NADPH-dependent 2,4-dienoyl-CoA reductase/sulfur reductase-like enzyme